MWRVKYSLVGVVHVHIKAMVFKRMNSGLIIIALIVGMIFHYSFLFKKSKCGRLLQV